MGNGIMGRFFYLLFLFVLLGLVGNASGAIAWTDGDPCDHLWSSTGNWNTGVLPTDANYVQLKEVGSNVCEIDANMTGATKALAGYLYGPGCFAGSGTTTLNISGELSVTEEFGIGHDNGATGVMNLSGSGSVTIGTEFRVGYRGDGTLNMTGGTINSVNKTYVGRNGVGTLNISNGTFTSGSFMTCGYYGTGTMNITGGTVNVDGPRFNIGFNAPGTVIMDGGTMNTLETSMAQFAAGAGSLTVNGGTYNVAGLFLVGEKGSGTLTVDGGTVNIGDDLCIAHLVDSSGNVALNDGTITAKNLVITVTGLMDIEAGTLILDGDDRAIVGGYVNDGLFTGYGSSRNVMVYYDGSDTIVTADDANRANYAWAPSPYDGETVSAWDFNDVTLVWAPGDAAAKHRIYFGQTFDDVNDANTSTAGIYKGEQNLDANEFDPGTLELGRSYYWRIDEVNGVDEWKGRVWTFRVQEYALVDDFEPYAHTGKLQAVWGSNGTLEEGLNVGGHGSSDSGQSMALAYYNASSPYYTEATRDYGSDQDWTGAGLKSLKSLELYFHGDKGNAADKIYVKLDDGSHSKAIYYDNPNAITEYWKWWQLWRIELADFSAGGVDLSKVRKIAIGVSQDPPAAGGGSGTIYVDDIRLYPTACFVDDALSKGGLVGDCQEVDFDDLDEMVSDWLVKGVNVPAIAPATGPVVWYKFDETSDVNAYDSSGNGYTATVSQSDAWDSGGYYNGCLDFYGFVDVVVPVGTFSTIDKQITVSVWVNGDASEQPVIDLLLNATISGASKCAVLYADPVNELVCRTSFHTSHLLSLEDQVHSGYLAPWQYAGQWNHYAFVKDADTGLQSIYLNGVLIAQEDSCFGSMAGVNVVTIGNYYANHPDRYFFGKMDDFRIYDYALSQAEIVSLSDQASAYQPVLSDADVSDDDSVDFEDFAILAENWFTQPLWP